MHYERCQYCRAIHEPGKPLAVKVRGRHYCKPSCATNHGQQLAQEELEGKLMGYRPRTFIHREHG